MGRPTKLTETVKANILKALRAGVTREVACKYSGIDDATFFRWMVWGKEGRKEYSEFRTLVETVESESEIRDAALIAQAATKNWKAAAWKLERRFPARWGARIQVTVDEELKQFLDDCETEFDPENYARLLRIAARRSGGK